jgi:hypothetical protein
MLIPACLALAPTGSVAHPVQALRLVLRRLARRYQFLSTEIGLADADRAAADHRRRQPGADALRGGVRPPVRSRTDPGQ